MAASTLSEADLSKVGDFFRLLCDPMRLRILGALREHEASVGELVEITGSSQPNVSKHLNLLRDAGVVNRRKEGTTAYYSIGADFIFDLCDVVCSNVDSLKPSG